MAYVEQAELEERLGPTMREAGAFLHSKGYYGPVGLDVLEDETKIQWVIDLNVRTGGSYILGTLRKHFVDRKLHHASLLMLTVKMGRKAFVERFLPDFLEGTVIIMTWYEKTKDKSSGYVVIGGETREGLRQKEKTFQALSGAEN